MTMKKIKFRAKSVKDEKYIYSNSIKFEKIGGLAFPQPYLRDENNNYFTRCILESVQQFTGMYDFDGNEIYEGDNIQSLRFPDMKYEVVWYHGCWAIKNHISELDENEFETLYEILKIFKFNVIGNIIDNSNLMRSK